MTIWCGLRAWPKDQQRAIFQPTGVAIFAMSAAWLCFGDSVAADTVWMFFICLPATFTRNLARSAVFLRAV